MIYIEYRVHPSLHWEEVVNVLSPQVLEFNSALRSQVIWLHHSWTFTPEAIPRRIVMEKFHFPRLGAVVQCNAGLDDASCTGRSVEEIAPGAIKAPEIK